MLQRKYRLKVRKSELQLILHSLVELRNSFIRQGRYTDCVDELILKISA